MCQTHRSNRDFCCANTAVKSRSSLCRHTGQITAYDESTHLSSDDLRFVKHTSQITTQVQANLNHDLRSAEHTVQSCDLRCARHIGKSHDLHSTKHKGQNLYQTQAGQSHGLNYTKRIGQSLYQAQAVKVTTYTILNT